MSNGSGEISSDTGGATSSFLSGRGKLIVASIVILLAFGYFAFNAFQGASAYYLTVDELLDRGASDNRMVRVNGSLVPESFTRDDGSTIAHFRIAHGGQELPAVYDGLVPDLFFDKHSQIVLEGSYGSDGMFHTDTVLVKCPSKYQALSETG